MRANVKNQLLRIAVLLALALAAACGQAKEDPGEAPAGQTDQTATAEVAPAEETRGEDAGSDIDGTQAPDPDCPAGLPGGAGWPLLLCEQFEDNRNEWQVESQDNPYARYTSEISEGQFQIDYAAKIFASFSRSALTWFDMGQAGDFALSASGLIDSRLATNSWGVAFRAAEEIESFFLFSIYNDGTYAFDIYENNGWIPLISRRPHNSIQLGQSNKLTILAEGQDFTFSINDQPVNTFEGGLLEGSGIQLMVSAGEGVNTRFVFDDIVLQTPPPS